MAGLFYVNVGGLGILWSILYCFTVYESPDDHPRITKEEHDYIMEALGGAQSKSVSFITTNSVSASTQLKFNKNGSLKS